MASKRLLVILLSGVVLLSYIAPVQVKASETWDVAITSEEESTEQYQDNQQQLSIGEGEKNEDEIENEEVVPRETDSELNEHDEENPEGNNYEEVKDDSEDINQESDFSEEQDSLTSSKEKKVDEQSIEKNSVQIDAADTYSVNDGYVSGDYIYTLLNGKAAIRDYKGANPILTIPSKIDGYIVNEVAFQFYGPSFREKSTLQSVTKVILPETIEAIGYNSFNDCILLASINIPKSCYVIYGAAFRNCTSLKNIEFPDSEVEINSDAFTRSGLITIKLPNTTFDGYYSAFGECSELRIISIPSGSGDTKGMEEYLTKWGLKDKITYWQHTHQFGEWYPWKKPTEWATGEESRKCVNCSAREDKVVPKLQTKSYKVTFDSNGGIVSKKSKTVKSGSTYGELPSATRIGYSFVGWFTAKTGGNKITSSTKVSITKDQKLYARWAKQYKVTYHANSGSLKTKNKIVTTGAKYGTLAKPTRSKYIFKGWYTKKSGGTKITKNSKVTLKKDQTLYAQWTKVNVKKGEVTKVTNLKGEKAKITIKKISSVKGYQVEYATKKNFKGSKKKTITNAGVTLKGLAKGKTYYVKVRGYKLDSDGKKVYGAWSDTKSVKIKK